MLSNFQKKYACLGVLLSSLLFVDKSSAQDIESGYKNDKVLTDTWVKAVIDDGKKALTGEFFLGRFSDRVYFIRAPINWNNDSDDSELKPVVVPKGFITDFASIPAIFHSILPPDGKYAAAAIVHDYLYWNQDVSREHADLVFWHAMRDLNVNIVQATSIYGVVRAGGWLAWKSNAERRASGERRVLRRFPQDLNITWSEWTKVPGVFQ